MRQWNDAELLSAYASRHSEEAFGVLVDRYIALIYSAALRQVQNPSLAEEVTQAAFTILAQKARGLNKRTVLSGWLCRTAHFVARNALKAEIRRQYRETEAHMQALNNEPEAEFWQQLVPLLDEAVAQLSEADRNAVVLRFYEKKPLNEMGEILGIDADAAQKRVSRALEKLRNFLVKRGVNSTAVAIGETISANSVQAAPAALAKAVTAMALAKGATASSTTLTLIKGALKIMAWTKAKTTMVAGASVLLAAGAATVTIKEIAAHKAEASWRMLNPDPDRAPQMVGILPTKFPASMDSLNVGSRGDNWVGVGESALQIIRVAYGWRPGRILFASLQPEGRYDFISTLPHGSGAALQAELKRKLGLVAHTETRDMDVLVLKVRRPNASGLLPPTSGNSDFINLGHYHCDNSPISSDSGWYPGISRFLEEYFRTPVIDQTGFTQKFQIDLKWNERFKEDPNHDALKQTLLDQLGLELVPSNMPIEMLVVEKAK